MNFKNQSNLTLFLIHFKIKAYLLFRVLRRLNRIVNFVWNAKQIVYLSRFTCHSSCNTLNSQLFQDINLPIWCRQLGLASDS